MSARSPKRQTVIVVDDDAGLRKALQYALEIEGFDVVTCATGEALLGLRLPSTPACLVVDEKLPGMSGIEVLETLRSRQVDLPAIIITSAPDARLRGRSLLAGARVIEKPLLGGHLTGAIRELL
jgi:FixJ family two-component response regulator